MPLVRAILMLTTTGTSAFILGESLQMLPLGVGMLYLSFKAPIQLSKGGWILFFSFVFVALLSALLSDHPYTAFDGTAHYILTGVFAFTLIPVLRESPSLSRTIFKLILLAGLVYMALFILFYSAKFNDIYYSWSAGMIGFRSIRHFGMFMALLTILSCFPLIENPKSTLVKITSIILITLFTSFLLLSGGRGGTLSLAFALIFLNILSPKKRLPISVVIILGLGLGLISSILIAPDEWSYGWQRAIGLTTLNAASINEISSGRIDLWSNTLHNIHDNILVGSGAGIFPTFGGTIETDHPHNSILQILADWGIIGFVIITIIVASFIRLIIINRASHMTSALFLSALTVLLYLYLHSLVSGAMFMRIDLIIAAIAVAVIIAKLPVNTPHTEPYRFSQWLTAGASCWVIITTVSAIWVSTAPNATNTLLLTKIPLLEMKVGGTAWRLDKFDKAGISLTEQDYDFLRVHCSEKTCLPAVNAHQTRAQHR